MHLIELPLQYENTGILEINVERVGICLSLDSGLVCQAAIQRLSVQDLFSNE